MSEIFLILTYLKGRTQEAKDTTTTALFCDNKDWIFEQDHTTCHDNNVVSHIEWKMFLIFPVNMMFPQNG